MSRMYPFAPSHGFARVICLGRKCLLLGVAALLLWLPMLASMGCQANQRTKQLVTWEGPRLRTGRMSANLGAARLKSGRLVVVGGSDKEYPFVPIQGKAAIELADRECILSNECRQQGDKCNCWYEAGIELNYPIAGAAFPLPDGRLIVFASVYVFNPDSDHDKPEPASDNEPTSGPVSAVIIDFERKLVTPLYRPKGNKPGNPPLKGGGPAILQRAFERNVQLRDGRIVRVGGNMIYQGPSPVAKCEQQRCTYCQGEKCEPADKPYACEKAADCPAQDGSSNYVVLDDIEIYTPPTSQHPLGQVEYLKMETARSSVGAIELKDGRVLITGGWGPRGAGTNENHISTYFLDPTTTPAALSPGPRTLFYREDHAMAMLKDGRVLITGGTDLDAKTINESEIYDPKKGVFLNAPSMTLTREDHIPVVFGPWVMFFGGEVNDKADQIRNTVEMFDAQTSDYIGPVFLFSRPSDGVDKGLSGVTDFGILPLDENTLILFGGQQGLQDQDGEYISAGRGSQRSLILQYQP